MRVIALDHTADVGLSIEGAADRASLFDAAARGMFALIEGLEPGEVVERGVEAGGAQSERVVECSAEEEAGLLHAWLRELLWIHVAEQSHYEGARFERLEKGALRARVRFVAAGGAVVRELKGVTYHDLRVARGAQGWNARVIFDV